MNIQAVMPQVNNIVNLPNNNIACGNEFEKILQQINEQSDIEEMKKFLDEKFNINTVVVEYSCEKTDSEAEMYDTSMLDKYDLNGGRNVIISKKTLLRMKKDSNFRQKVYKSIGDIPFSDKLTGGCVKSNGVFIHEDGTGGYYLEFDWGDEEDQPKSKKSRSVYSDSPEIKDLNNLVDDEHNNMDVQTEFVASLIGAYVNKKDR